MTTLEVRLREVRAKGRKALVPYFMGGLGTDWLDTVDAAIFAGADAIEIGVPFSDPMMDGLIIQQAAIRALRDGATLTNILEGLASRQFEVPIVVMTYTNIVHHHGYLRAVQDLAAAGVAGIILPDLSFEESTDWRTMAANADVATVLMVAPSTPLERAGRIARASEGFCYAQARMSVTGLSEAGFVAPPVLEALREASDIPTYLGIGITTPDDARAAASVADGVIVGSALVQRLLDGHGAPGVESFVASLRNALD